MHIISALAQFAHVLAAIVWIGGLFFAYMALRPAAAALDVPKRLALWARTFARFFPWVFVAIGLLYISGTVLIFYSRGLAGNYHIHAMIGLAVVMTLLFLHVYFVPYRRLRQKVTTEDWEGASKDLAQIRFLVGLNLIIGLSLVAVATVGSKLS